MLNRLQQYTFSHIHQQILQTSTAEQAAANLGVQLATLKRYLGKFIYNNKPLTLVILKELSEEQVRAGFPHYDQVMQAPKIDLNKYPMAYIHQQIRHTSTDANAAANLGVDVGILKRHLGKFIYNNNPLTLAVLKTLSEERARGLFPQYNQAMQAPKIDINKYTMAYIHQQIHNASTDGDAAANLGVKLATLKRYLGKFIYNNTPLTLAVLKELSEEQARRLFPQYDQAMQAPKIDLKKYTMAYIHQQVRHASTNEDAATNLGVDIATLKTHLGKFRYNNNPLTVVALKELSEEQARAGFPQYDQPMQAPKIDLKKYTMAYIYQQVHHALAEVDAAANLGVQLVTLKRYLKTFIYNNTPLTLTVFRTLSIDEVQQLEQTHHISPEVNLNTMNPSPEPTIGIEINENLFSNFTELRTPLNTEILGAAIETDDTEIQFGTDVSYEPMISIEADENRSVTDTFPAQVNLSYKRKLDVDEPDELSGFGRDYLKGAHNRIPYVVNNISKPLIYREAGDENIQAPPLNKSGLLTEGFFSRALKKAKMAETPQLNQSLTLDDLSGNEYLLDR